jgi:hypothetical protein
VTVGEYQAPLATLGLQDSAITVLASGFLDPSSNSNGAGFGLFAALASGGDFIPLPVNTARIQVIHNSADLAADTVDVWVDGNRAIPNFAFRTATPFIDLPTGVGLDISVTGAGAVDTTGAVYRLEDLILTHDSTYIVVANGIVSGSGYSPNVPFELYLFDQGREQSATGLTTDLVVFHGSTDAPTVDITEPVITQATIIDDLQYGTFRGYLSVPTLDATFGIEDSAGTTELFRYNAPLATLGLGGEAITVLASGFLDSTQNSNGAGFGLWVALSSGGALIPLPEDVGSGIVDINGLQGEWNVFPNPTQGPFNLELSLSNEAEVQVQLINLNGQVIDAAANLIGSQISTRLDLSNEANGIYLLEVRQGEQLIIQTPVLKF